MPGCPFRNFEPCPEHNKQGGCIFWIAYASSSGVTDARMEGCAVSLTPMLLLENANALGHVAGEVNKTGAEISAFRADQREAGTALGARVLHVAAQSLHQRNSQRQSIAEVRHA